MGWAMSAEQQEGETYLSGYIGYEDIKDLTSDGMLTLYARFTVKETESIHTVIIGYWSYSDYVTTEVATAIKEEFEQYLIDNGYEKYNVIMRKYTQSKVADLVDAIQEDGDVDYFIGGGKNITSTAGTVSGNKLTTVGSAVQMTTRYIVQLTENELAEKFTAYSQTDGNRLAGI